MPLKNGITAKEFAGQTRRRFLIVAAALLLIFGDVANADIDGAVVVTLQPATNRHYAHAYLNGRQANDEDLLPPEVSADKALVFKKMTPDSLPPVVDKHDGAIYSRLWIDMDGSGTYDDGEFVQLTPDHPKAPSLPSFQCLVNDAGYKRSVTFQGYLNLFNTPPNLILRSGISFEGAMTLGAHEFLLSVRDNDGDGCVVECSEDESTGGALFCIALATDTNDLIALPLARTMVIFSQAYAMDLSIGGGADAPTLEVRMTPTNLDLGELRIDGENVKWLSMTRPGLSLLARPDDRNTCRIPAGKWEFCEVVVREGSQDYKAHQGWYGATGNIEVEEGKTVVKGLGGRLDHKLEVKGALLAGRVTIQVGHATGVGGLAYEPISRNSSERGWLVRSLKGKVIASGNFEFG